MLTEQQNQRCIFLFILFCFRPQCMGKAGRRKQTWGSKRLYRVATSVLLLIYSTSEETNCIGDDGEFVCTRERHRKIILQWLMSKVTQVFYWILTWTIKRKQQILKSQCSALSHTSLWLKKSVRKKKPTQVINRGNLSTILLWTTSVDFYSFFLLQSC